MEVQIFHKGCTTIVIQLQSAAPFLPLFALPILQRKRGAALLFRLQERENQQVVARDFSGDVFIGFSSKYMRIHFRVLDGHVLKTYKRTSISSRQYYCY